MKKTFVFFVIALFAISIILTACKDEQAGEAYSRFRSSKLTRTTTIQTPIKQLSCTYRESSPVCSGDIAITRYQDTNCESGERKIYCDKQGMICKEGRCAEPCRAMNSEPFCYRSYVRHTEVDRRCNTRTVTDMNCADTARICRNGACTPTEDAPSSTGLEAGDFTTEAGGGLCELTNHAYCINITHMANTTTFPDCHNETLIADCSEWGATCSVNTCVW